MRDHGTKVYMSADTKYPFAWYGSGVDVHGGTLIFVPFIELASFAKSPEEIAR